MTPRKKLIEVASAYDKMPGIGAHPKGIHHWWARLPLPVSRAVLFASVVDDPSSHPDKLHAEEAQDLERERLFMIIRALMQKQLHKHPEAYAEARAEMLKHCDGKLPALLDPFASGGSIPLEAARLGMEAYAGDLNPVGKIGGKDGRVLRISLPTAGSNSKPTTLHRVALATSLAMALHHSIASASRALSAAIAR